MSRKQKIPPDNYSAAERQMIRLRNLAARADAEKLIAEKFGMEWPEDIFEQTSLFQNGTPPHLRAYEEQLDLEHWQREQDAAEAAKRPSIWVRIKAWLGR